MGKRLACCVVAGTLVLAGCGDDQLTQSGAAEKPSPTTSSTMGDEAPAFEEDDADAVLDYALLDYKFDGPLEVDAGKVFFTATNEGTEDHELEVLDADEEALGEVEAMPPGDEGSAAIELEPGTYTLQCILETADGKVHRDLGMVATLEVK